MRPRSFWWLSGWAAPEDIFPGVAVWEIGSHLGRGIEESEVSVFPRVEAGGADDGRSDIAGK